MTSLGVAIKQIRDWITLKEWRLRRARERYEFLKAEICKRHYAGYAGLIVDFKGRRFGIMDLASFKAPMYYSVKNCNKKWCIFWDRGRMTQEIGVGGPIQDGAVTIQPKGRIKPEGTPETIDEQKPLVVPVSSDEQAE